MRPWLTILLIVFGVAGSAWGWLSPEQAYAALYANGGQIWVEGKWWGIFGSAFLHADFLHLAFNVYWVWVFGREVERQLGPARYALFLAVAAGTSALAELAWGGEPGVGLSGINYAFFGYMLLGRSLEPRFRGILSPARIRLFVCWFFLCIALTQGGVWTVANAAHAGGWVFGMLAWPAARRSWRQARYWRVALVAWVLSTGVVLFWAPWQEQWTVAHTYRLFQGEDREAALKELQRLREAFPENTWALKQELMLELGAGRYENAVRGYERFLATQEDAEVLNNLAWIRATCPVDSLRDGASAVRLAQRACDLTDWKHYYAVNTLAMSWAEAGDFERARTLADKAAALAGDEAGSLKVYHDALRASKPWREQAKSEVGP